MVRSLGRQKRSACCRERTNSAFGVASLPSRHRLGLALEGKLRDRSRTEAPRATFGTPGWANRR